MRHGQFVRAAGEHDVLAPVFNGLIGITDGLAGRRASGAGGQHSSGNTEINAYVDRRSVAHAAQITGGFEAAGIGVLQRADELQQCVRAADGRTIGDSQPARCQDTILAQTRVQQRQLRGAHAQARHPSHTAQILSGEVVRHVELGGCTQITLQAGHIVPFGHESHG